MRFYSVDWRGRVMPWMITYHQIAPSNENCCCLSRPSSSAAHRLRPYSSSQIFHKLIDILRRRAEMYHRLPTIAMVVVAGSQKTHDKILALVLGVSLGIDFLVNCPS